MTRRDTKSRVSGRHRRGADAGPAHPRRWDPAERAAARQLDQLEPGWAVWYGVGARCFYAVASWTTHGPLLVQARTADELRDLMREAERPGPAPHPSPPPAPRSSPRTPHPSQGVTMPEAPEGPRTVCWDLPPDLSMVGKTRSMVNEILISWALHTLADDVILVVGELLANAITYGEPPVRLSLSAEAEGLRVQVTDHGRDQPRRLDLGIEAVHGRGLTIVEALAHECGATRLPDGPGKTVWARWHLPNSSRGSL
ncbi:ATP-binding protein [Sphaerisporangium sp. NPDC088356]|uniref:ATP-binding protein n=1 Tax=Sphaerisporangium sp. NPDC088356 TaxID=3154871 RepID=UPI003448A675